MEEQIAGSLNRPHKLAHNIIGMFVLGMPDAGATEMNGCVFL